MYKQKLVFCSQEVNKKHVRRENRRGVEHVIISSFTLPPDIVMNGGLYPSDEVERSYQSLNRTPVTIEHPELDGMYVSANDPEIDFEYRFGAFNENATQLDDGRIQVDKVINVQKAMMSEKGKRLLDRINELETSKSPRAIHTSVGVYVDAEELDKPKTNSDGQEYGWIARNMIFDHDAILLDSVGAATPEQGTGIGINSEQVKVEHFIMSNQNDDDSKEPVNNQTDEDDAMREEIIAKLKELEIEVNADISDSDLLAQYNEALTANSGDDENADEGSDAPEVNAELAETVKKQADQIAELEANAKAKEEAEVADKIKTIKANAKYADLSDEALKAIHANSQEDFDKMYNESIPSYGVGSTTDFNDEVDSKFAFNTKVEDLPE